MAENSICGEHQLFWHGIYDYGDIKTVKTPPAANMPKLKPIIPKKICLRNINCLPLPVGSLYQCIVYIPLIDTHLHFDNQCV